MSSFQSLSHTPASSTAPSMTSFPVESDEIRLTRISSTADDDRIRPAPSLTSHEAPDHAVDQEDIPPNGGYGWVVCACVFLINAHTWGVNSAWGVFLAHYLSDNTFPGATHLEYALIGGLSISQSFMISPLINTSNRKLGTRISLLIGTFLVFGSLLGASFATQIWHLFLSQGVCFGWGMGFLYVTASSILPQWFSTHRSLAVGLASSGAGLGGLAYNLAAGAAVSTLGLPWTYRVLAFCALGVNLLCSLLVRDRNKSIQPTHAAFNYKEYMRTEVRLVITWGILTELGYIVLLYSLPNYASSIGLSPHQGSVVGALLNLGLGLGRPVIGYYSDNFGRINMATSMTALCGILCLALWVPAKSYPVLLVFALLSGTVCGTFWSTVAPVTAEVVGLKRLPSSFGMVVFALVLPTIFAEPIALRLVQVAGGYIGSQIFVGCMFLGGAGSMLLLRAWKVSESEMKAQHEEGYEVGELEREMRTRQATGFGTGRMNASAGRAGHGMWLSPRKLFFIGRL